MTSHQPVNRRLRRLWLPLLVSLGLTLVVFGPVLAGTYVYDGRILMERLRGVPLSAIPDLFVPERFSPLTGILSWRPFTALTCLLVDHRLCAANPAGSIAVNLLLHAINGWLLFLLLGHFIKPAENSRVNGPALMGASLFLVHPLVSEAVLCVGFRADLISATILLLSAHLALRWARTRRGWTLAGMALLFLTGLLFKEVTAVAVVTIPALLVASRWPHGARTDYPGRRKAVETAAVSALLLLTTLALFACAWLRFRYTAYDSTFMGGAGRALGMANAWVALKEVYLHALFFPWPLRIEYAFLPIAEFADPRLAAAGLVLGVLFLLMAGGLCHRRICWLGLIWFVAGFLPVLQVVPIPEAVAERFAYVPMLGVGLFTAGLGEAVRGWPRLPHRAATVAAAAFLAVLAGLSFRRSMDWQDDIRLNLANWECGGDGRPIVLEKRAGLYLLQADREWQRGKPAACATALRHAQANLDRLLTQQPGRAEAHRLSALCALASLRLLSDPPDIRESHFRLVARHHAAIALQLAPRDPLVQASARAAGREPEP